jgi:DNA-binding GntR family transcriptional regulator
MRLIFANWELIKQARCASTVVPEHGKAWIANSIKRHRRIVTALKKGGEDAACAAVFENIDSSEREIVSRLREVGWIEASGSQKA